MSIASAEIAKVCLNAYITVKISFANSVANLCEQIPGADVDAITRAIGADRRISPHYFQGGLAFGGTCFPRDTRAYVSLAERYGVQSELVEATDRVNKYQDRHLVEVVLRELESSRDRDVGILGLSFVPRTPVITESPAIKLIHELLRNDVRVTAYDALALDGVRAVFGETIAYASTPEACLRDASVCVVTLRAAEYKTAAERFAPQHEMTIVDCWRLLDPAKLDPAIRHVALGRMTSEVSSLAAVEAARLGLGVAAD
jgi:UDPglucose 6-dehydrogenase